MVTRTRIFMCFFLLFFVLIVPAVSQEKKLTDLPVLAIQEGEEEKKDDKAPLIVVENRKSGSVLAASAEVLYGVKLPDVRQEKYGPTTLQQWLLRPLGNGVYMFENRQDKRALEYGEKVGGVYAWRKSKDDSARWEVIPLKSDFVKIKNKATGKLLDLESDDRDATTRLSDDNGSTRQEWRLRLVD